MNRDIIFDIITVIRKRLRMDIIECPSTVIMSSHSTGIVAVIIRENVKSVFDFNATSKLYVSAPGIKNAISLFVIFNLL
jgi:hypothetical protein